MPGHSPSERRRALVVDTDRALIAAHITKFTLDKASATCDALGLPSPQALGDLDVGSGTLTGVYDSGTAFSFYFERYDQSRIQLVAVPEPVSMLMQAMSLIVIAALRGRSMGRASS